ncbi:hemin uptake protein HemP [Parvibaculum sedimenti]|uniref:Hemin uptake protein HemP n=1 Tax=Parvibaculum sedimenti TaxID=2608632 RepID=A0A6N6VIV0_9HYPH|nr:hemin uptake protein HemP [Parvibaculum sedimenti]KAB7738811.1 hemin uptake protein HemP [Parvibaculum sedimenti]
MKNEAPPDPGVAAGARPAERSVASHLLFGGRREVIIDHGGERYRLRITGSNKLILIK